MLGVVINENFCSDDNIKLSMAKNVRESHNFSCLSLFMLPAITKGNQSQRFNIFLDLQLTAIIKVILLFEMNEMQ